MAECATGIAACRPPLREAAFPATAHREFDYEANPNVDPAVVNHLVACDWISRATLCLFGDSGTGKSHLLIGLGTAAAKAGYRVRYTMASSS